MSKKEKILYVVCIVIALIMCFTYWIQNESEQNNQKKYNPDDIIGLTSKEVIEKYGDFEYTFSERSEDGYYSNTSCGYIVEEKKVGFLGTTPEKYFMISFDENGVAVICKVIVGRRGG